MSQTTAELRAAYGLDDLIILYDEVDHYVPGERKRIYHNDPAIWLNTFEQVVELLERRAAVEGPSDTPLTYCGITVTIQHTQLEIPIGWRLWEATTKKDVASCWTLALGNGEKLVFAFIPEGEPRWTYERMMRDYWKLLATTGDGSAWSGVSHDGIGNRLIVAASSQKTADSIFVATKLMAS